MTLLDGLVKLAQMRRAVLVVDDAIAMLGGVGEFGRVEEDAWTVNRPDSNC